MTFKVLVLPPIIIMALFLTFPALANSIVQSRIHDIDYGVQPDEDTLILLENGSVLWTKDKEKNSLLTKNSQLLKISFDRNNYILDVKESLLTAEQESRSTAPYSYEPTVVDGLDKAKAFFNSNRKHVRGPSECFNRAHVWSYELWRSHQVKSQKIFIFFSRRYIREHRFKWWFHVAPMILVNEGTKIVERVLDSKFNRSPEEVHNWKSTFIGKHIECKTITNYSDYADYPYMNDCSFFKTPMFIHQPLDLEMYEVWGIQKTGFTQADLTIAYENAFRINYNGGF